MYISPFDKPEERFILMQYTGLKDKNGKEIYDGDVLHSEYCEQWFNWLVLYHEGHPCLQNIGVDGYMHEPMMLISSAAADRIVCGNVHQNPELLKK